MVMPFKAHMSTLIKQKPKMTTIITFANQNLSESEKAEILGRFLYEFAKIYAKIKINNDSD